MRKTHMLLVAGLLACVLTLSACTDPKGATETLSDQGYTNITITGHAWLGCSKEDTWATAFVATTVAGVRVRGTVCDGGWLGKGATIRTFGRATG